MMNTPSSSRIWLLVSWIAILGLFSAHALYQVANKGMWPESWPKQLEPLRSQSRTLAHSQFVIYEIPFSDRAAFEAAWPEILKVRSKGGTLTLRSGPDKRLGGVMKAGVRITAPRTGQMVAPDGSMFPAGTKQSVKGRKLLRIGPPWPDGLKSDDGALPEYVLDQDGKWVAYKIDPKQEAPRTIRRARVDLELIVDGEVVDLERIALPDDAKIADQRTKPSSER